MENKLDKVKRILAQYKQLHLLDFVGALTIEEIENLLNQFESIDFEKMRSLYQGSVSNGKEKLSNHRDISPIHCDVLNNYNELKQKKFLEIGESVLGMGKIAVVTMAGGQGTRLGHKGPKGTFNIGYPINKTLFQLQNERLKSLSEKYKRWIPWYIMTSGEAHEDTIKYFECNNYFGYEKREVFFFQQGALPMLSFDGKILLKEKNEIYFGPDGNGSVFHSLKRSGALEDMTNKGIEWVFFTGIDNALVKMADPIFVGYAINSDVNAASKSVPKKHPEERAGVFCLKESKPSIVEYSEIPEELIRMSNANGQLLFGDVNILVHLFRISELHKIAEEGLPYHTVVKNAACIDRNGKKVEVSSYKYESFIFDAFKVLDRVAILQVVREMEFAPIKNKVGEDSPETAVRQLIQLERI
ncbi:MAG: UDP-N-acetylglucosamine pyrophosphorylase [Clostridia bacterium]|jgi:UDP-N-acetylglucosamine/UDP-N-acetylgalactosamine diphosphorylase|nr:UDP-N-acetylglucosamine pyrophosphorylase [Clostridia bacterium]